MIKLIEIDDFINKNKGIKPVVGYCVANTQYGEMLICSIIDSLVKGNKNETGGIAYCAFTDTKIKNNKARVEIALKYFKKYLPDFSLKEDKGVFQVRAIEYINNLGKFDKDLNLIVKGTDFQIKVWDELLKIPKGKVKKYSEISRYIGNANASRAVGTAIGKNPVAIIIPCHRVVRADGGLGGYHWGEKIKEELLEQEGYMKK